MPKINILDKHVADKIAAGEVVERPASVVKELLENSLDAGATQVKISLQQGGREMIQIIDDGIGMTTEEAKLALQRFATSKIDSWEDLERLDTFGFRGEAMPSIAAVSKMEISTRPHDKSTGIRLLIEGGDVIEETEAGVPPGTMITVRDLFYNTPARRKFLKSPAAETSHIIGIAQKLSLVNEDTGIRLTSNGREIFDFPPQMSVKERILKIWGLPLDYEVIPFDEESSSLRVWGYICKPDKLKSHRSYQLFFVNGRYIKNTMINQAVAEGFSPLLPAGKFPIALVFLEIPGPDIDVNVHPNKMEVRFLRAGHIFKTVRDAIKKELRSFGYSPVLPSLVDPAISEPVRGFSTSQTPAGHTMRSYTSPPGTTTGPTSMRDLPLNHSHPYPDLPMDFSDLASESSKPLQPPVKTAEPFSALAQVQNTYIIGQSGSEVWIIDQHTAHERINYEKLASLGKDMSRSQRLLFPILLELPSALFNFIMGKEKEFEKIGFEMEHFGRESVLIKAVPFGFQRLEKKENLMSVIEEVASEHPHRNLEEFLDNLRASIACKASVKAGDPLTIEEMNSLVNELIRMDYSSFCPHGRPVVVKLSKDHLDRMFHRK